MPDACPDHLKMFEEPRPIPLAPLRTVDYSELMI